jgi:hypothetical protein
MRPNGFIIMMASTFLYFVKRGLNVQSLRRWAWAAALCVCLLLPRMYWNSTHQAGWSLSVQGDSWLASVAGVVASHGQNLDAHQAEDAWFAAKGLSPTRAEAMQTLLGRWPVTAWLSLKGSARVLFGHVNTEWWHLITGRTPVGPSWFKPPESRADAPLTTGELMIWVAGMAILMVWALCFYREVFLCLRTPWRKNEGLERGWLLAMALLMAALPLVYGEARFRLAVWPFLFMILLRGKNEAPGKA